MSLLSHSSGTNRGFQGALQGTDAGETHFGRNLRSFRGALLDPPAGSLTSQPAQILTGRDTRFPFELTRERSRAHVHESSHLRDAGDVIEVARQPALQLAQRLAVCRTLRQCLAELSLVGLSLQEYDELAGYGLRHANAKIFFHERERQIDARCNPGRRIDRPI